MGKKNVLFIASFAGCPRVLKMAKILPKFRYNVTLLEWDRNSRLNHTETREDILIYRMKLSAPFGLGLFCYLPIWWLQIFLYVLTHDFDIIQSQNLDNLLPIWFLSRIRKIKIMYDLADFYSDAYIVNAPVISTFCAMIERLLIRRVNALILVSQRQILQIKENNLPATVGLYYNTPSCLPEHLPKQANEQPFSILYAGILGDDRVKLIVNAIKAAKALPVVFYIAGFGPNANDIRNISKRNPQVIFLGEIDSATVIKLTSETNLVLLPYDPHYFNNRIGLPNKFFEAMSCGTLVLASRGTYVGEIVEREQIGLVVDYNDTMELRYTIEKLIKDKCCDVAIRDKAKKLYAEIYAPRKTNPEYLKLVDQVDSL